MSKLYSELENLYDQDVLINQEQVSILEWLIKHREDINNIEIDYLNYFQDAQEKIKELAELIERKYKDLTIKEILIELMKADTDNCEVKFKSGNLEFTLDIIITKIVKDDVVEYDASEDEADE